MSFVPVLRPFFPLSGVLVMHTVIVFALSKDARRCSKAYITGLILMELALFSQILATVAPPSMTVFWNKMLMASRCALCPCWLWLALEMSGMRPFGLEGRRAFALAMAPIALACVVLFTNSFHGWYWPTTRLEGQTLVVERGPASALTTFYCQVMLLASSVIYVVGIKRHRGNERLRLLLLGIAYAVFFVGDWLWLLGRRIPGLPGVNPLSFLMAISFFIVGASVPLYGYPRARGPITEADIRAMPPIKLPEPARAKTEGEKKPRQEASSGSMAASAGGPPPFPAPHELTERQLDILRMLMEGLPYKTIAAELGIAERTVKYHMGQILDKCGLETREQLIVWAALRGLNASPPAM